MSPQSQKNALHTELFDSLKNFGEQTRQAIIQDQDLQLRFDLLFQRGTEARTSIELTEEQERIREKRLQTGAIGARLIFFRLPFLQLQNDLYGIQKASPAIIRSEQEGALYYMDVVTQTSTIKTQIPKQDLDYRHYYYEEPEQNTRQLRLYVQRDSQPYIANNHDIRAVEAIYERDRNRRTGTPRTESHNLFTAYLATRDLQPNYLTDQGNTTAIDLVKQTEQGIKERLGLTL